jgi:glycosyltransferase involved in cell wall biosynthesis
MEDGSLHVAESQTQASPEFMAARGLRLTGKRAGMVVFSPYPADPRPRRAAEALLREGMIIDLLCEAGDRLPPRETLGSLHVTRIPIRHYRGGALSYAYQYSTFIAISAVILAWRTLRKRYDLIYVHNMPDILVISALIPRLFGARVILDQHDPMPELMMTIFNRSETSFAVRVIRRLEKWSIACVDRVITVNEACRKIFSGRSCSAEKVAVIMNSPDGGIFRYRAARSYPVRCLSAPFVMMYHGSLVERNGLALAIDALASLLPIIPQAELRVFGKSTSYLEAVMEKVREMGLEKNVSYRGARKLEELVGEIEACDVGVIPNLRNTFTDINTPTRIFEYLALGKPVIAPNTAGIRDYFSPESLIFFESGDPDDLAKAMTFAASSPEEAVVNAERGQQVYLDHSWQREREDLVDLVADLVTKEKRN